MPEAAPRHDSEAGAPRAPFWALAVGTFGGAGLSPKAPGTVGSVASLALWAPLVLLEASPVVRLAVAAVVFALGTLASAAVVKARGEDPQIVVVDEVAGMGVTLCLSPPGVASLVLGFLLFRLFDIWKPWPVRLADRRVKGGFGVMLDDVIAGGYALLCLQLFERFVLPRFS
jgi:phosphatidylglycerophosphatase A